MCLLQASKGALQEKYQLFNASFERPDIREKITRKKLGCKLNKTDSTFGFYLTQDIVRPSIHNCCFLTLRETNNSKLCSNLLFYRLK